MRIDLNNLPEKAPEQWRDVCEATSRIHTKNITPEQVDAICDYTWDLYRDIVKLDESTRENASTNKNEDIENGQ
ncbi:MAG: hypothetical protein E2O29_02175 [Deltaproteobacteria bacterium]|nr:MAG: hypothetical protein E2O29_02175 [Deltaproteobacteria bacterium]